MDSELNNTDICRFCRFESQPDRPLYHPCICTGSIKWIHQECLLQWMRYSGKEHCELCSYHFSFTPIYSPDMPRRVPIRDLAVGLLWSVLRAVRYWFHYSLVSIAWLGLVPLSACRIYRALFAGTLSAILRLPADMISSQNLASDIFHGCFVVTCTLFTFAGLVWLREQILHGGGPDWLQRGGGGVVGGAGAAHAGDNNNNHNENNGEQEAEVVQPPTPTGVQDENQEIRPEMAQQNVLEENFADEGIIEEDNLVPPPHQIPAVQPPVQPAQRQQPQVVEENLPQIPENAVAGEDNNWIQVDWDRAAEEITWERLLGLDGSLQFLEHVFWVISLHTLFILIFAYAPYHMGVQILAIFHVEEMTTVSHFNGLITTLIGYCSVGLWFLVIHRVADAFGLRRTKRIVGLGYVVVKVSILCVLEVGVLPLVCGWWLDICTLAMFDATLKEREASLRAAPGTSIFIHWLIGMVYVYYFASFMLLLREILRPGVLWFIRNFNDPDFSPIQEMIHLPIIEHLRKLLISAMIFGSVVLLMLWLPLRLLKQYYPKFLPFTVSSNTSDNPALHELSFEMLLLQVILPSLLEQAHTRNWLKALVRGWCRLVSWILNIHSYLIGDTLPAPTQNQPPNQEGVAGAGAGAGGGGGEVNRELGAIHQALLAIEPPLDFQPYQRPNFFHLRLLILIFFMCISLTAFSFAALTVPIWLGRHFAYLWLFIPNFANFPTYNRLNIIAALQNQNGANGTSGGHGGGGGLGRWGSGEMDANARIHELYTAASGIYLCWLCARAVSMVIEWLPQGRGTLLKRLQNWAFLAMRMSIAGVLLLGIIPLLFGMLLEVVVIVPYRVPLNQTPVLFIWQDWALGILYTKIACALILLGPDWVFKRAIERVYMEGVRDLHLEFLWRQVALPVIVCLGMALAVPYVLVHTFLPLFVSSAAVRWLVARRLYPYTFATWIVCCVIAMQVKQFRKMYEHIKNDKYLMGRRLENYNHTQRKGSTKSGGSGGNNNGKNAGDFGGRREDGAAGVGVVDGAAVGGD